jgi:cytochrome c5
MNRKSFLTAALWVFVPAALVSWVSAQTTHTQTMKTFPEGPGKQVVEQVCLQCHEAAYLLRQHRTEGNWQKTVARMAKMAPAGAAQNYDAVSAYLFANFGKPGPDIEPVQDPTTELPPGTGRGGRGGRGGAAAGGRGGPPAAGGAVAAKTIADFPDGPGKQFVQQICMQCHEPAFLSQQHKGEEDWMKTVARMSKKGLGGPVENYEAAGAYMAKNFGRDLSAEKVNVNTSTVDELVAKLGLTKEEATALVGYRTKNGDFHEWGEILVIYGVDGHKIKAVKDKLSF